jgi:hypothetical protein
MDVSVGPSEAAQPCANSALEVLSWPSFDDGNVMIKVGCKQFRVHRSVLSAQSPVFRDMFSLCDVSESGSIAGELPEVSLSDSEEDVKHVLGALYLPL